MRSRSKNPHFEQWAINLQSELKGPLFLKMKSNRLPQVVCRDPQHNQTLKARMVFILGTEEFAL
jgi:hypothetical protein